MHKKQHKTSHLPNSRKYTQLKARPRESILTLRPCANRLSKWIRISTRYYALTYCIHCDPHKDIRYNIMINDKMLTNVILQALPGTWLLVLRVQVWCKCCAVSESMTPILLAINFPEAFVKMIKRQKRTTSFALQRQMLIYSARFPFRYLMDGTAIGKGKSIVLQYRRWLLE